jgi:hypothetical protein
LKQGITVSKLVREMLAMMTKRKPVEMER